IVRIFWWCLLLRRCIRLYFSPQRRSRRYLELVHRFGIFVLAGSCAFWAQVTASQADSSYLPETGPSKEVKIYISSGKLIQLETPAATMFVADPAIADIQLPAPDRVFIYGKKPGRTTFYALRADGTQSDSFNVVVTYNIDDLNRFLKAQAGDLPIEI